MKREREAYNANTGPSREDVEEIFSPDCESCDFFCYSYEPEGRYPECSVLIHGNYEDCPEMEQDNSCPNCRGTGIGSFAFGSESSCSACGGRGY